MVDADDLTARLRAAWRDLCPYHPGLGERLLQRWSEPHRHYHTPTHLAAVLAAVDRLAEPHHDRELVALAAWYHDAVYDLPPDPLGNEEASARLAETELAPVLGPQRAGEVARLVRVTSEHRVDAHDHDAALLCDADLAVLAGDPADYRTYAEAVRREYDQVPEADFRAGRARILDALLAEPLFRTARGRELEPAARRNLAAEIAELRSGSGAGEPTD